MPARDAQGRFVKGGGGNDRFVPSPAGFAQVLDSPTGVVGKDLVRRVLAVQSMAKGLCPVRSGRLRSSIRWRIERDARGPVGIVGTDVEYAYWVHEGTGPHPIEARDALALYWEGAEHPVVSVNHPGTRPRPFLRDSLRAALL